MRITAAVFEVTDSELLVLLIELLNYSEFLKALHCKKIISFNIISSCLHQRNIWTSLKQHKFTNNINNARISYWIKYQSLIFREYILFVFFFFPPLANCVFLFHNHKPNKNEWGLCIKQFEKTICHWDVLWKQGSCYALNFSSFSSQFILFHLRHIM